MITFIKSDDGERISAIKDGVEIAYIKKNRFGTHGHWRGWEHYVRYEGDGKCHRVNMLSSVVTGVIDKDNPFKTWSDEPPLFSEIKSFKAYTTKKVGE